ncbi:MAG: protein-methionine-sulfoxide reductase catalytic subunit MsrP [Rhodospirillales bacterium]|nr:protein-methionine-sulfoxide reductase catalytic subunit MsrP [Rhodospirillales bacterium]MDE0713196.1 protein-methionine-sulfoxide reductase catalytic subunit MsrP [Rhodospirillales bacterium]
MAIRIPRGWELPESAVTPESVFLNRRQIIQGLAAGSIAAAAPGLAWGATDSDDPSAGLYPVARDERFVPGEGRKVTAEEWATRYNNFYEFGTSKKIWKAAQALKIRPWEVRIDGEVESPRTIAIDDLLAQMPLEERVYRHRCVEAWSMVVPWSGFAFREFVRFANPTANARYVAMETFLDPDTAKGQRQDWYPWPYVEGLTMEEANHELAFLVTGLYGKPLPRQNGSPLRLAVPWKYGFKSIKSIVRFTFTAERPVSFWEEMNSKEYGFWANVNPAVPHPRWSQATEKDLGTGKRIPTKIFNGYEEWVAALYEGNTDSTLYR